MGDIKRWYIREQCISIQDMCEAIRDLIDMGENPALNNYIDSIMVSAMKIDNEILDNSRVQ